MRQTGRSSVKNSGRDPQTLHTFIHTEQAVAIHRFVHEVICVAKTAKDNNFPFDVIKHQQSRKLSARRHC
jgi:hypothetical protein